ncbi:hypothetical protein MAR_037736 [Mya arenaria]|uniref:Uncharacterized protein n=1 Tax=Mya arenaria TaxID=6604 RepID=A0ABY7FPI9_MYAAR|nr:hypothetical protein MAR_037736 [Mya arenaria]
MEEEQLLNKFVGAWLYGVVQLMADFLSLAQSKFNQKGEVIHVKTCQTTAFYSRLNNYILNKKQN